MIVPFIPEDLFELNSNLKPKFNGEVIIIDNIFKNYEEILKVCNNMSVETWKITPTSRNFKDYYDCRLIVNNFFYSNKINNRLNLLISYIRKYFKEKNDLKVEKELKINYFKHLKNNISSNYQFFPHYDYNYNAIFYIDPFENGGTALYENVNIDNKEEENILFDISTLKIKQIIKSKPNRVVIFRGNQLHGGYIENHNIYYYNWRINLVNFF